MLVLAAALFLQAGQEVGPLIEELEKKMVRLAASLEASEPENAERLRRGAKLLRERWAAGRAAEAVEEWKRGNAENALRHGESVTESLQRLIAVLEGREKPRPERHLPEAELLVALEEELNRLIARQEAVNGAVRKEEGDVATRPQLARRRELASEQGAIAGVADEVQRWLTKQEAPVFAYGVERAIEPMQEAREALERGEAGKTTRERQDEALRRLKEVLESCREARTEVKARPGDPGKEPGGPGGEPPKRRVPTTAELELIKRMQTDLYDRTKRANASTTELTAAAQALFRRLSDEQGKIAGLLQNVIERMAREE